MTQFENLYDFFNDRIADEIEDISKREPQNLYNPITYSLGIGGKRVRPVLLLMAYKMYRDDFEQAMPAAMAIEVFHNFTLLHDDIMDNALVRRNNHAVHVKYSPNAALLSGDAMSILAYDYMAKCRTNKYREVIEIFSQTALQICEGQQLDMDFEQTLDVKVNDYLHMIGLKTAVLLAASLKIGAMLAEAPEPDCNRLYQFGFNLGMAFQLQDDYLDTFGNQESFGKKIGGDIVANKKTFLLLKALEISQKEQNDELKMLISQKEMGEKDKINRVKKLYTDLCIDKISMEKMQEFFLLAKKFRDAVDVTEEKKGGFYEVTGMLMKRQN
ncbi:MAG: polyprenyl synthetase family protein [Prolixibacteraceae bacterium]|nr:polyprenyl synthetase family protein [Prolixibacteraceae bacterium]